MGQLIVNKNYLDDTSIDTSIVDDFLKLQKELKSLEQQVKYIKQREKKRSWKKYGRL